jgi:hypothetical protein
MSATAGAAEKVRISGRLSQMPERKREGNGPLWDHPSLCRIEKVFIIPEEMREEVREEQKITAGQPQALPNRTERERDGPNVMIMSES